MPSRKISILTPSYNQGKYIEQNIQSVLNQNYSNYEHIILDGGSKDNTLEILRKYPHLRWISEKDRGQSHALNKGLDMASGEIIGWLNSDDYYERDIFYDVVSCFKNDEVIWVKGDIVLLNEQKSTSVLVTNKSFTFESIKKGKPWEVAQPGTFFKREAALKVGGYDETLHMTMDGDLWIRLAKISSPVIIHKTWAFFRIHENQKTNGSNILKQIKEIKYSYNKNNLPFSSAFKLIYPLILSFIKKKTKYRVKCLMASQ
ncbi:MAG: glycosyltransferase [Bacteroidales bacterium]|nr:glycosyltransferase [Bacteroidales bacterium]